MSDTPSEPTSPNDPFEAAVAEFLRLGEEGAQPDPDGFVRRFPDLEGRLREFFAGLVLFDGLATDLAPLARRRPDSVRAASGLRLGDFQLLDELGRGGMGVVYRARQVKLERFVALKVIRSGAWANSEERTRFEAEARAAARLSHPNIVQVFEVGEHDGQPFLALELVGGGSLASQCRGAPWEARRAARLLEALARGVQHAHEHGVVHRDLKPDNVLLTTDGVPKIADFGLARRTDVDTSLSRSGVLAGTPSYMAPEQAAGKSKEVGPAADVWALGVILYELLTGRPPFRAASVLDTLSQVRQDDPAPPSRLVGRLPRDLETICLKCLAKEPHKRYSGAAALADDLQRFLGDRPILARRVGALGRAARWCRRNPMAAGMAAAVAFLLLLLAGGASVAAFLLNEERKAAEQGRQDALNNLARAEEAERRRTEQLATSYLEQARARRFSRQPGQHFQSLEALAEAARIVHGMKLDDGTRAERLRELRNEAIACLALTDLRPQRRLADVFIDNHGTGFQQAVAFNPTWDAYARAEPDGPISVRNLADDRELVRLPGGAAGAAYILAFSPDGHYLLAKYFQGDRPREYIVWDWRNSRQAVRQVVDPNVTAAANVDFAFTPDKQHVLLGCRADCLLTCCDLATGKEVRSLGAGASRPWVIALDAEGRRLATGDGAGVTVRDPRTGAPLSAPWRFAANQWSLAWCPGSDLLAVNVGKQIHLVNPVTRQTRAVLEGHESEVTKLAFNPTGTLLASSSWDTTTRLWDAASGKELLQVPGEFMQFSPDGRLLAYVKGKELGIWEVADGGVCRRLVHPGDLKQTRFSPDGRSLAVATEEGTFLWDVASGQQLARLEPRPSRVSLFHPSGAFLLNACKGGVSRWPLRPAAEGDGQWRLGPPTAIPLPLERHVSSAALDAAGHKLAVVDSLHKALIVDLDGRAEPLVLSGDRHPNMNYIDISPDGRWAATTTWKGVDVKVWDLNTRKEVPPFRTSSRAGAVFSLDGHWLVVIDEGQSVRSFHRVGSWELARQEHLEPGDGAVAFTADGMMATAEQGGRAIRLCDAATGHTWATLPILPGEHVGYLRFSPDGSRLAACAGHIVEVWDLRALRARLADMGLD